MFREGIDCLHPSFKSSNPDIYQSFPTLFRPPPRLPWLAGSGWSRRATSVLVGVCAFRSSYGAFDEH